MVAERVLAQCKMKRRWRIARPGGTSQYGKFPNETKWATLLSALSAGKKERKDGPAKTSK